MKHPLYIILLFFFIFESCAQETKQENTIINDASSLNNDSIANSVTEHKIIDSSGTILETRILPPSQFQRTEAKKNSYSEYLRNLPVKPHGSEVLYYDGSVKTNHGTYDAVINLAIGNRDLHQCADAVMRLRAEYLWHQKRYDDIHFNFTNGFQVDYSKWMNGKRMVIKGNKTYWVNKTTPSNTYEDFWKYMELIFNYAGTLSLSKELAPVEIDSMKIGDVFIWGGSPGHAILVIDIAKNPSNSEKVFLLAQSYMPAQETQILQNPHNTKLSPWYSVSEIGEELITPEWTFSINELKRFIE